jgi:hypothetical protein
MKWISLWWWKYLFEKPNGDLGRIRTAVCRARNHPEGVWWYNMNGDEPDMHCKNCNDDLG